jgi:hypothetical protein
VAVRAALRGTVLKNSGNLQSAAAAAGAEIAVKHARASLPDLPRSLRP